MPAAEAAKHAPMTGRIHVVMTDAGPILVSTLVITAVPTTGASCPIACAPSAAAMTSCGVAGYAAAR